MQTDLKLPSAAARGPPKANCRIGPFTTVYDEGIQTDKNDPSLAVHFPFALAVHFPLEVPEPAARDPLPFVSLFSARDLFRGWPALKKPTWQNKESTQ